MQTQSLNMFKIEAPLIFFFFLQPSSFPLGQLAIPALLQNPTGVAGIWAEVEENNTAALLKDSQDPRPRGGKKNPTP